MTRRSSTISALATMALATALLLPLSACTASTSPRPADTQSQEEPTVSTDNSADVQAALLEGIPSLQNVTTARSQSGLSYGQVVEVVRDDAQPFTTEELTEVLRIVWTTVDVEPASISVTLETTASGEKRAVLFDEAADGLGVRWSAFRGGIVVTKGALAQLLGEWSSTS